jgi:hypothetical protein
VAEIEPGHCSLILQSILPVSAFGSRSTEETQGARQESRLVTSPYLLRGGQIQRILPDGTAVLNPIRLRESVCFSAVNSVARKAIERTLSALRANRDGLMETHQRLRHKYNERLLKFPDYPLQFPAVYEGDR